MLGTRLQEIADDLGLKSQQIAQFLGFSRSAPSKWREREAEGKEPDFASIKRVAVVMQLSLDFLAGTPGAERWAPAVIKARPDIRHTAISSEHLRTGSAATRLLFAWNALRQFVPEFSEDTWLLYLRWKPEDWSCCLEGSLQPSGVQVDAASSITGLPVAWFYTGEPRFLAPLTDTERRRLDEYMAAENIGPEELIRVYRQSKHPRA